MHGSEHTRLFRLFRSDAVIFRLFKAFSSSLQHIRRTSRANIHDQLIENATIMNVDVILSDVFWVQISDCYPMCLQFVCKQSDKNHSVHGCPFLAVIFSMLFSVCDDCILKSTTAWLLKLSVLNIHSSMRVHNRTFQTKTVFDNVTEVHNPL